jgi:hypothetical protein
MLRRRKHGTTDQLALPHQYRQSGEIAETVRSAPGRDPRMARFIRILSVLARESHDTGGSRSTRWLDTGASPGVFRPTSGRYTPGYTRLCQDFGISH